nr:MAG TPA: hypothetical protein [Caudoviricetes sp.]
MPPKNSNLTKQLLQSKRGRITRPSPLAPLSAFVAWVTFPTFKGLLLYARTS